jgi:3-methylfumaryl-CoA hydratase
MTSRLSSRLFSSSAPLTIDHWLSSLSSSLPASSIIKETLSPTPLVRYLATFDSLERLAFVQNSLSSPSGFPPGVNFPLPPCFHWCLFTPNTPTSMLSHDGYESTYSPPDSTGFIKRMFAGGSISYASPSLSSPLSLLDLSQPLQRTSKLSSIPLLKQGKSGPLLFVSVEHCYQRITNTSNLPFIIEKQNFVYRSVDSLLLNKENNENTSQPLLYDYQLDHSPVLNSLLLFRYSVLTFNSHLIHYSEAHSQIEGYKNLLVHGPLQASILADFAVSKVGTKLKSFDFRALQPLFVDTPVNVRGKRVRENGNSKQFLFWICDKEDESKRFMEAKVEIW